MKKLTTTATKGGWGVVGKKSEWEHCAPDGLVASPHLDAALPTSIRFRWLFHNNRERPSPRPHNTRGTTDDNCQATDPWQSVAFYGVGQFIAPRDFFFRARESEGIGRSVGVRLFLDDVENPRSYGNVLMMNNEIKEGTAQVTMKLIFARIKK